MGKFAKRTDNNHKPILKYLEQFVKVYDTSDCGRGIPDLQVNIHGRIFPIEIKNKETAYGRKGLNKNQLSYKDFAGDSLILINSIEEAEQFLIKHGVICER